MSGITVRSVVRFGRAPESREPIATPPAAGRPSPPIRAARMLALAHFIDCQVEAGAIQSYAEAARALGVTRGRMSQIMNLLNLSVQIQEGILLGNLHISEHGLRASGASPEWDSRST